MIPAGKSRVVKKFAKRLNKQRKRQGLKKIKVVDVKLAKWNIAMDYVINDMLKFYGVK